MFVLVDINDNLIQFCLANEKCIISVNGCCHLVQYVEFTLASHFTFSKGVLNSHMKYYHTDQMKILNVSREADNQESIVLCNANRWQGMPAGAITPP